MALTHDAVRGWAEAILAQLGAPAGYRLTVTGTGFTDSVPEPAPAASGAFTSSLTLSFEPDSGGGLDTEPAGLLVTVAFDEESASGVRLEARVPQVEAVVLLADQLQDAVLEETCGAPLPECPGHGHPAVARVVDGAACWACPSTGTALRPILPADG